MYEHKDLPLLSRKRFIIRLLWHVYCSHNYPNYWQLAYYFTSLMKDELDASHYQHRLYYFCGAPYTLELFTVTFLLAIYGLLVNIMVLALLATIAAPVVHRLLHKFSLR